jgi:hypothetical protein
MREGGERRQGEESAFVITRVLSQGFFWRSHYCAPVEGGSHATRFDSSSKLEEPINFTGRGVYRFLSEKLVNLLGCKLKLPSKDSLFVKQ